MSTLNENIKNFRSFRGINQETLASLLGKTKSVISNWERGANSPDPDSIEALCKYLGVTPNQIFGWEDNPEYEAWKKRLLLTSKKINDLIKRRESLNQEIAELEKEQEQLRALDEKLENESEKLKDSEKHVLKLKRKTLDDYSYTFDDLDIDILKKEEKKDGSSKKN